MPTIRSTDHKLTIKLLFVFNYLLLTVAGQCRTGSRFTPKVSRSLHRASPIVRTASGQEAHLHYRFNCVSSGNYPYWLALCLFAICLFAICLLALYLLALYPNVRNATTSLPVDTIVWTSIAQGTGDVKAYPSPNPLYIWNRAIYMALPLRSDEKVLVINSYNAPRGPVYKFIALMTNATRKPKSNIYSIKFCPSCSCQLI